MLAALAAMVYVRLARQRPQGGRERALQRIGETDAVLEHEEQPCREDRVGGDRGHHRYKRIDERCEDRPDVQAADPGAGADHTGEAADTGLPEHAFDLGPGPLVKDDEGVLRALEQAGKKPSKEEIEAHNKAVLERGPADEAGMVGISSVPSVVSILPPANSCSMRP